MAQRLFTAVHNHRHGVSTYLFKVDMPENSPEYPASWTPDARHVIRSLDIDFEPGRDEWIEIEAQPSIDEIVSIDLNSLGIEDAKVHSDWYYDGIEDGDDGREALWRTDFPDVQVQLFASVEDHGDSTAEYTGECRLFIEHDVRDNADESKRVKYSGEHFDLNEKDAVLLLQMDRSRVAVFLELKIAEVKAMPNDPKMCV